ncbi:MAG TPA: ferritin [Candidatus Omnitrophota bacterium]|nr:ferritin [Candidatus Omnitrophota bacterium]HQL40769.1 ferritin [Candidatus Omnitrophota bacterium]
MDKKMEKEMNAQINREMFSSYLYLAMAAYFDAESLGGFAQWMKAQAIEEMAHAMKFYSYIFDRGGVVTLDAIEKPEGSFKSVQEVFEKTLDHEKFVTKNINNLYSLAQKQNDNASLIFLEWFVTEQVEEEKNALDILAKLKYVGDKGQGILMLDKELGARPMPTLASLLGQVTDEAGA